jgi:rubrerythrin
MKALKGTKTHDNLKAAFAGESQANRRYLYFAAKAERRHANRLQKALDQLSD